MATELISGAAIWAQIYTFLQVLTFGILIVGSLLFFFYIRAYNFKVEKNIYTGSGIEINQVRARKVNEDNVVKLRTFRGESFLFPPSSDYVYKTRGGWFVRYLIRSNDHIDPMKLVKKGWFGDAKLVEEEEEVTSFLNAPYHPIRINMDLEEHEFKPVPQNLRYMHKQMTKNLEEKFKKHKDFLERYGQIMGLGILVIGFIIGLFFMLEKIGDITALANTALETAKTVREIPSK